MPKRLVPIIGKTFLKQSLGTADLRAANERKWPVVATLKGILSAAQKSLDAGDPINAEALRIRLNYSMPMQVSNAAIPDLVREVEEDYGEERAKEIWQVISGRATPIDYLADAFKAHKSYTIKGAKDFSRVLDMLAKWLERNSLHTTVEALDRSAAKRFIREELAGKLSRNRAGTYLGFLREYWKWMEEQGHIEHESPWRGLALPSPPRRVAHEGEPDGGKRPYTDAELATLIYGPAPPILADLMRIAALSGMRIEEICQLRVSDCEGGIFSIPAGKTENAKRRIPVHSALVAIVDRRIEGKRPTDYLIEELPPVPLSRDSRSDPASKRFSRYRCNIGVDERPNDKAKSNVDFHSFRRWFILKARDEMANPEAGYTPWVIADVVGHSDGGIKQMLHLTMSHYPGKTPPEAMRPCVEAVQLPPESLAQHKDTDQ